MIKVGAIVVFSLLGAWRIAAAEPGSPVGFSNYVSDGGFLPNGIGGMWVAVIIAIFSYFSVEMIAVAAGEAEEPERAIRSAFKTTVFRLVLFYLLRSEEHTSELQSLMRSSYAVFCLKKKTP